MTRGEMSLMAEKLMAVRALPSLQTTRWEEVSTAIGSLASGLQKYAKYLQTSTERVNILHQQMQPARLAKTGQSDAVV